METESTRQFLIMMRPVARCLLTIAVYLSPITVATMGFAQTDPDTVIVRRANSDDTINRKGTIVEWKGMTLTLHSKGISDVAKEQH